MDYCSSSRSKRKRKEPGRYVDSEGYKVHTHAACISRRDVGTGERHMVSRVKNERMDVKAYTLHKAQKKETKPPDTQSCKYILKEQMSACV